MSDKEDLRTPFTMPPQGEKQPNLTDIYETLRFTATLIKAQEQTLSWVNSTILPPHIQLM